MSNGAVKVAMETEPDSSVVAGFEAATRSVVAKKRTHNIDRGLPQGGPVAAGADTEAQLELEWVVVLGFRGS